MAIVANSTKPVRATSTTWQAIFKHSYRDPFEFCASLGLPESIAHKAVHGQGNFKLFCPSPLASRIQRGDLHDPILKQVLPTANENISVSPLETSDPLQERRFEFAPGVLKKYDGRALLITTGVCAVNCRYCFRRFHPYQQSPKSIQAWAESLSMIEKDTSIEELILSGGDPLALNDKLLSELVQRISDMSHVKRLRIHTRLPVVIPQRVCEAFLSWISKIEPKVVCVIHCNHANEIDESVFGAMGKLREAGVTLLNQSVLLRGINDDLQSMIQLSERLLEAGVVPYYLHQMDPVLGASHFHVPIEEGRSLVEEMRGKVSGYLVPRYVVERPGELSKTLIV